MNREVKAKKSLGQNFLHDEGVVEAILSTAAIGPDDCVLEIGPGTGVLTTKLAQRAKKVVAIELDHRLVELLQRSFEQSKQVSILEANVLDVDLNELIEQADFRTGNYKVVANIPYYITAPIIRTLLSLKVQPKSLTLMVQKEVAERLSAKPGDMSLLSVMAQHLSDVSIAFLVPPEAFEPIPEVESAVVELFPKRLYSKEDDHRLFRLARAGFAARRKTLANNLSSSFQIERKKIETLFESIGLRKDIRAQALSIDDWEKLPDHFEMLETSPKARKTP